MRKIILKYLESDSMRTEATESIEANEVLEPKEC